MPVLPLHSLTSQSLDAKFANKQRRYAANYSASYVHQPPPPPRLSAPPRPPNPTFETLRAAAARLNLPEEHEQPGPTMATSLPARRHPVRKALLRTAAVLALCALAAGGTVAWTVRTPDGGLAPASVILAAMTQRFHDLTASQAIFAVVDERVATLRQALSQALAKAWPAARPVQEAAETLSPRPTPPMQPVVELAAPAALPAPPAPPPLGTPDASGPADAAVASRPPQPAETAASAPDAAGQATAQAEPAPAATPPNATGAGAAIVTAQQLVNTFALVRQTGLLVRDMQVENERLRAQLAGATGTLVSKVTELEQRLAATARDAHDMRDENAQLQAQVARLADTLQNSRAPEQRPSPAPARGPAVAAEESGRRQEAATAQAAAPSSDGAAAADATAPGVARTVHDYRVQAASLGVAVLGDANAVQGQASRYLVAVGDQVPGVGRVISITLRGTSWVVLTDHGVIQ